MLFSIEIITFKALYEFQYFFVPSRHGINHIAFLSRDQTCYKLQCFFVLTSEMQSIAMFFCAEIGNPGGVALGCSNLRMGGSSVRLRNVT